MAEASIISSKTSQKQILFGQEKQGFEKLSSDIKESVFQVLYLVLKDQDDPLIVFLFSTGADYFQNLAFTFYQQIYSIWKATQLLDIVMNFFNFFQLQTYFGEAFTYPKFVASFYVTVAVIILVFINVIYVSYAFSKKRVSAIWPVVVLRSITGLVFTLFFLPLTQLLVAMFQCQTADDGSGNYVLYYYQSVECFKGTHIIHATVAIIITALFSVVGLVVALAYFEVRMMTEDSTARQHSRGDVVFTINKILLQLSFAFFSNQWILVLALVIPAAILWYIYNVEEPYYNKHCTMFFRITTTYYLWTNFMALISKLLEDTNFTGGLITWAVALPFIGGIMLTSSRSKSNSLVETSSRFKTSDDLLDHLRFVLQLIDTYKTDKNATIFLTGYIEKHKDTCEEEDCPLKTTNKRRLSTSGADQLDQMILGLILVVDRMYETGIKKFKGSAKLRIAYCVFLIERKKNTRKAEQELARAKEMNLGFVDEFTIFRLTKLINDGFEGVDVVGLIAWENYKNLYNEYVKQSADLHKEFWFELKEDRPNLLKLNYLGSRINTALTYAQDYWARLQKIRNDDPVILRTYGKFLIDIQNDIVEGMDIMQKAKKLMAKKVHYQIARKNSFDAGTNEYPYVELIGNGSDMGIIKSANLLFTILVGVGRDEIINKKINNFMPDLFSQYHDSFLKNYNSREEDVDIKYLDNDNELFVKSKSGYIIPVLLRVSRIKTEEASNKFMFGAWLRNENLKRNSVYFICKPDGTITDMTATAVTILNLSIQQIRRTRMTIDKIVPGVLNPGFKEKTPGEMLYRTDSGVAVFLMATVLPVQLRDENNGEFRDVYQALNPGKPPYNGIYGYIVKVEKVEKHHHGSQLNNAATDFSRYPTEKSGRYRRQSHMLEPVQSFHIPSKSDQENLVATEGGQIIYGFDTEKMDLEINELFQNDGVKLDFENLMKGDDKNQREQVDYGEGITHKKYIGGRLIEFGDEAEEVELAKRKQWEEEAEEEDSLFLKEDDDLNILDEKKRKDKLGALKRLVKDALETNSRTTAIARLKGLTCLWTLSIILIGGFQYFFLQDLFSGYRNKLHILNIYSDQITEISQINAVLIDFITLNENPGLQTTFDAANIEQRRKELKTSVNNLVNLAGEFNEDQYLSYLNTLNEPTLSLEIYTVSGIQIIKKGLTESIAFLTAKAFTLHQDDLSSFTLDSPQVNTVMFNNINLIIPALREMFSNLRSSMNESLGKIKFQFILLAAVNVVSALLILFSVVRSLNNIEQKKSDVLLLFLEIPPKNVELIGKKRDKFIEFFEAVTKQDMNDDESIESENSIEEKWEGALFDKGNSKNEEEGEALANRKKLIKKYRATNFQKAKDSIFKVLILTLLSIAYSASNIGQLFATKISLLRYSEQYFVNNLLSDVVLTAVNMNRLMMISQYINVNGENIEDEAFDSLKDLNKLGDGLEDFFLFITESNKSIKDSVKRFYNQNACLGLTDQSSIDDCESGLNQALKMGFFNLTLYRSKDTPPEGLRDEIFKSLSDQYDRFQANSADVDFIIMFEINDYYNKFADKIVTNFNSEEEDYLKDILSQASYVQEIILIVYLFVIILLAVYFWLGFIIKLEVEIWKTTRMITMIPLDVVNHIPNIKKFLKNVIRTSS